MKGTIKLFGYFVLSGVGMMAGMSLWQSVIEPKVSEAAIKLAESVKKKEN